MALAVLVPLLIAAFWIIRGTDFLPRQVWWIALALQLILSGTAFASMELGEIDAEQAEQVVPESAIETHAEAAEAFTWASVGMIPLLFALCVADRKTLQHVLAAATLAGSVAILFLGVRVGDAGGEIVYEHGLTRLGPDSGDTGSGDTGAAPDAPDERRGDDPDDNDDDD